MIADAKIKQLSRTAKCDGSKMGGFDLEWSVPRQAHLISGNNIVFDGYPVRDAFGEGHFISIF